MKLFEYSILKKIFYFISFLFLIKCQNNDKCLQCVIDNNKCSCPDDNQNCECDTYCRPNLYSNTGCYYCPYERSTFLNPYKISNGKCSVLNPATLCQDLLTYENNQCVDDCGEGYKLGSYCFKTCNNLQFRIKTSSEERECECQNYYNEIIINDKTYYNCVEDCPYYNDAETKKCLDKCEGINSRIEGKACKKNYCGDIKNFRYQVGSDESTQKNYCLDKCPDEANFYYEKTFSDNEVQCIKKCNDYDFYSKTNFGYVCSSECSHALIDLSSNILECKDNIFDSNGNCPDSFPYKYLGSCFRNCQDTKKLTSFGSTSTYFYNYNNQKICSETCQESYIDAESVQQIDIKYIDGNKLNCVDCKETSYKFHFRNTCLEKCKANNNDNEHPYYYHDTKECVPNCGDDFTLKGENVCYEECPTNTEYIYNHNKICSTCKIPEDPDSPKEGEGYYINSLVNYEPPVENPIIIKDEKDQIFCLDFCPERHYTGSDGKEYYMHRKSDDNECIFAESCDSIPNSDYKYSIGRVDEQVTICYRSCKDIPGNKYIYEKDYLCQESFDSSENYYYYESSGIYKYVKNNEEINTCSSLGLNYLYGNKCVKDCSSGQYTIKYTEVNGYISKLGECYDSLESLSSDILEKCNYYFIEEKIICFSQCNYRLLKQQRSSTDIETSSEGNCVINCPPGFPYEYEDEIENKKYCLKNCDHYYYYNNGKKKCINDCTTIYKYNPIDTTDKECLNQCPKKPGQLTYYFYNDKEKYYCLSSCENQEDNLGNKIEFALEAKESPQKCIKECPIGYKYYYETDKICLENCGTNGFIKEKGKYECTLNCGEEEYIINGNTCSSECPENEKFVREKYVRGKTLKYCSYQCKIDPEDSNLNFYYHNTQKNIYECLSSCGSKKEYGNVCLDECPKGLYEESNKCLPKCDIQLYYEKKNDIYECKNICSDGYFISSTNECIEKCPLGENFIGTNNKCKSSCEPSDGQYFRIKEKITNIPSYIIYECTSNCNIDDVDSNNKEMYVEGGKECVKNCPDDKPYYNEKDYTCYSLCSNTPDVPFSVIENTEKKCDVKCPENQYFQNDKICVDDCSGFNDIINDQDNSCVHSCKINSYYKFLKNVIVTNDPPNTRKHCVNSCTKYTSHDYYCYEGEICPKPYNYINGNECQEKCPDNLYANPIDDNDPPNEYKCQISCDSGYFHYKDEYICFKDCKPGYGVENSDICVRSCNELSNNQVHYYSYSPEKTDNAGSNGENTDKINICVTECPSDKPFKDIDDTCSEKCKFNGYQYYTLLDKICLSNCIGEYYKKNEADDEKGYECLKECPTDKYLNESNFCVGNCKEESNIGIYSSKTEKKCVKKCGEKEYIEDFTCVSSCPTGDNSNKYIIGQNCVKYCSGEKKYYIGTFEHGETDLNNYCYIDCPIDYQFYEEIEEEETQTDGSLIQIETGKCKGSCEGYYISSKDSNIIAKQCVEECPVDKNYKYYVKYNNTHKECFEICPNGLDYFIPSTSDPINPTECFSPCPSNYPYHKRGSFECIKECDSESNPNYVDYFNKQCLSSCPISSFWIKGGKTIENNIDVIFCVDNCKDVEEARFSTPERECVLTCDETKFLRGNSEKGICECMNLFYYNNKTGVHDCFNKDITTCGEKGTAAESYKIQIYNSKQCIQNCYGVLSPSENICYINGEQCPQNSIKGIFNGKIKCECKYKYYFNENKEKICLSEYEQCPETYSYFIPEENQCVKSCDPDIYQLIFDNNCYKGSTCPAGMSLTTDKKGCECSRYWYKTVENKYFCLKNEENCTYFYPYLIKNTRECVQKCNRTGYEILYNNECLSSCGNNMIQVEIEDNNPLKNYAKKTCRCQNAWYEDICSKNSDDTCIDLKISNLNFQVKATKECVEKCPDYYKFYFNNECFISCDNAKNEYGYDVKQEENSNKCVCNGFYRINDDNTMECLEKCDEQNDITIYETKQCVKSDDRENFKCPIESPYLFNYVCYKNCPEGSEIDNVKGNACKCKDTSYWFKQTTGLIVCLSEKCPYNNFPYIISSTKECITSKDECTEKGYEKISNYTCYKKCPYLLIDNENECVCDQKYYWYKYKDPNELREYLVCNLKECPEDKPDSLKDTKECITKCGDKNLYEYSNICYEECPAFTEKNDNSYTCEFSTESNDIQSLVESVTNRIVDIYNDIPEGGLVINNDEASLQIYGININNLNNTDSIKRTNLAYINLNGCIKKIYESNSMDSEDDIVVVKLDLKSKNKKLAINPVEYQFINSKNGKVLDASVCEKNAVVISYPMTYMLNSQKKRNLDEDENTQNEDEIKKKDIMDKFNKGKELYEQDNSIDTFNFNNSIYYDICKNVEFDGKDLVLESRIQSLFPNYSFCESVCTYDHTDFMGERIYCNCSIKTSIDLDRTQEAKIYQLSKTELDNNQKGPTNIPVLKCLSKAKISGNGAFYYSIIFIIIEVILLFVVIFYSYKLLINKIRHKVLDENDNNNINNDNKEGDKKSLEYYNSENNRINENKLDKNSKYKHVINDSNTNRKMNNDEIKINANPPKHNVENANENENEKIEREINFNKKKLKDDLVKNKHHHHKHIDIKINEKNNFDIFSEIKNENENNINNAEIEKYLQKNEIETTKSFYQSMKEKKKLLTSKYNYSLTQDKFDSVIIVSTSIFDKIYLIKILLLSGKYDIKPLKFSLYLLCHMLLLTFVTFFYDIKTIKNIWQKEDYPNTNYYLLYGFLSNIIVWLIYNIFCCLLDNEINVKKINNEIKQKKEQKYKKIISKIKRNMIIYLVLQFLILTFCSFYLITFCGIYIRTKKNVFQSYGIAFIEIIIIKIIYGFILGVLRKVSLSQKIKILYNIVLILNKYVS